MNYLTDDDNSITNDELLELERNANHEKRTSIGEDRRRAVNLLALITEVRRMRSKVIHQGQDLKVWSDWGDATVAVIEPLEGDAVWHHADVRKFIAEAVGSVELLRNVIRTGIRLMRCSDDIDIPAKDVIQAEEDYNKAVELLGDQEWLHV